jgi:2-oxoglutarate dehydrogenase E2 component (dihydrolipoamide succinyltransferase)
VLGEVLHGVGDTVHPGDVLAVLEEARTAASGQPAAHASAGAPSGAGGAQAAEPGQAAAGRPAQGAAAGAEQAGAGAPAVGEAAASRAAEPSAQDAAPAGGRAQAEAERPHASPVARRMAEEHGIDLSQVVGSGTSGRVTREDVERHLGRTDGAPQAAAAPSAPSTQPAAPGPQPSTAGRREERVRMSRRRQTIAQRLLEAQRTAAMLTTFNEVDMSGIMAIRARHRDAFKQRHGVSLGFMSFFTRAVVGALKAFPMLNAEIRGDEIILKRYYDIGIAVGAEGGLVVPIVRDADQKSFAQIEREIAELAEKARTNTLSLDDLRGGTFTITNGGVFGSLLSTPILSPPQVGILGMHKIEQRPVAIDGQVVIRPMMYLALSYDHRLVDGREAVQFLVRIKELVEDPTTLLLD